MSIYVVLLLFFIGLIASAYGTIVGAGGGFIFVPALLLLLSYDPPIAAGTGLVVVLINALSGVVGYVRQKRVNYRFGLILSSAAIPGTFLGVWLSRIVTGHAFYLIFAVMLMSLGIFLLVKKEPKTASVEEGRFQQEAAATLTPEGEQEAAEVGVKALATGGGAYPVSAEHASEDRVSAVDFSNERAFPADEELLGTERVRLFDSAGDPGAFGASSSFAQREEGAAAADFAAAEGKAAPSQKKAWYQGFGATEMGLIGIGFILGVIASFFGIGGGWLMVPILIYLFRVSPHIATATSVFSLSIYSLVGVFTHGAEGNIDWLTVLWGGLGTIIGSQLGVLISRRLPGRLIVQMLAVLLVFIGATMIR